MPACLPQIVPLGVAFKFLDFASLWHKAACRNGAQNVNASKILPKEN